MYTYCVAVVCQLQAELTRCLELRKQNLRGCIDAARTELAQLYDLCLIGTEDRGALQNTGQLPM